jgi:hypothetical protein
LSGGPIDVRVIPASKGGQRLMSGRFILLAIAAIGWLIAAVFAYAFISLFGFFGVGFYGLLLLFICAQVELESDGRAGRSGAHGQARQDMWRVQRASQPLQQRLGIGTTRFFVNLGIALTAIGFGGFLYFQLD